MFSLRNRFGIPGVISVIALVFAMLGGAYAASNSSGGGKATASAAGKRGPRGPKGATGPAGAPGAQGLAGPAGANGKDGANGTNGATGATGTNGKNVETGNASVGECAEGGATVQVSGEPATKKKICNGAKGAPGATGATGEINTSGPLPSGKSETGGWAVSGEFPKTRLNENFFGLARTSISFPIALSADLEAGNVQSNPAGYDGSAEATPEEENCPGSVAEPKAASGFLCVYTATIEGAINLSPFVEKLTSSGFGQALGVSRGGALLVVGVGNEHEPEPVSAWGSWAVTG